MSTAPTPAGQPRDRDLYRLLDELDRLEELLEEMIDLNVFSRSDVERRLAQLNREVDDRSDA